MRKNILGRQLFAELWAKGETYDAMAVALGTSKRVLIRWREQMGIPRRPKGRRSASDLASATRSDEAEGESRAK